MPTGRFFLAFTDLPNETRPTLAGLIAHELKQRGWKAEAVDDQSSNVVRRLGGEAIVLAAINSNNPEAPDSLVRFVEVGIGPKDEKSNTLDGEHLDVTKIVLPADAEPKRSVAEILSKLEGMGLLGGPAPKDSSYDEDDEAVIRSRLEALGYL